MKQTLSIIAILLTLATSSTAEDWKQIVDLRGTWKFQLGDKKQWSDPKFDDSKWDDIFVPEVWENEGYPGYDGYAWYRKKFTIPSSAQEKNLYFHGGYIDDACRIYLNGHLIGGGGLFPPNFETAYDREEIFSIPKEYVKFEQENVVAIRVYDDFKYGGITRGKVGLFEHRDEMKLAVHLPNLWKFKTGDDKQWAEPATDDSKWQELIVPLPWDYQGYEEYDGFGWYRVTFEIPDNLQNEKLFVVLGKVDDIDEAYMNGTKIGNTGRMDGRRWIDKIQEEYRELRVYRIPPSTIKYNQKNVLALRVYDKMRYGGICEGPIGIITEREYKRLNLESEIRHQNEKSRFERLLDKIFND